jgi:predicted metal-dependent peptidase
MAETKICPPPKNYPNPPTITFSSEEQLYSQLVDKGMEEQYLGYGIGDGEPDFFISEQDSCQSKSCHRPPNWQKLFAEGIQLALQKTVTQIVVGPQDDSSVTPQTPAQQAKQWFVSNYPLLGALASSFKLIEDQQECETLNISVAAVSYETKTLYYNRRLKHSPEELRFIIAHELMHVALRHGERCRYRDPFLWNVACDFVINQWLVEMEVGKPPLEIGLLDPELKGLSAEEVYSRITTQIRRYRKLLTFAGKGLDILDYSSQTFNQLDLDAFCRQALMQGLFYHQTKQRGYLPAALIEEIYSLFQPPIPWDVELAHWFEENFAVQQKLRSYARSSRRQSATPDIPRAGVLTQPENEAPRTFGVILDTSGSMAPRLLGKALGAIASFSMAKEISFVRVIFCDACAYDAGYMPPEDLLWRVQVKGRGGTVLQPGINLLEKTTDFPSKGPILIITDGKCDNLTIKSKHAFLLPKNNNLPFPPKGKVFYFT